VPYTAGSKKSRMRVDASFVGRPHWEAIEEKESGSMYSLIDLVRETNVGWIGIKPFASGSVFKARGAPDSPFKDEDDKRARLTLRHVLWNDFLTCTIPGMITPSQVHNAANAILERRELDLVERQQLGQAVDEMWENLPSDYEWLKKEWEYV